MKDFESAKKSLGQHWLEDPATLESIINTAEVGPADTILEIGPGLGSLTQLLTVRSGRVIAVELDKQLAESLKEKVTAANLEVLNEDILRLDFGQLPAAYKLVANIPYYLTGNLLRLLSDTNNPPQLAVLLVQKEVAERIAAEPGKLSIIAVIAQLNWQVELGNIVPAELFAPPPKVDSQVLILRRRSDSLFTDIDDQFYRLIKIGFAQPRKTLLNNLSNGLHASKEETAAIFKKANISPGRRPQTLSLDEWHSLHLAVNA
jgi:16S rRNA (adenine1518-N6/adenine1519-N6)-dimethyltransferase